MLWIGAAIADLAPVAQAGSVHMHSRAVSLSAGVARAASIPHHEGHTRMAMLSQTQQVVMGLIFSLTLTSEVYFFC